MSADQLIEAIRLQPTSIGRLIALVTAVEQYANRTDFGHCTEEIDLVRDYLIDAVMAAERVYLEAA